MFAFDIFISFVNSIILQV